MSANVDGTATCDGCGKQLPNTSVVYSFIISYMDGDGEAQVMHLCTTIPDPCGVSVFKGPALRWLINKLGKDISVHQEAHHG